MKVTALLSRKALALEALRTQEGVADPFLLLMDWDHFRRGLRDCRAAFPAHFRHCFAIKANPTRLVLAEAAKEGLGFEAASIGELRMAGRAAKGPFVVYDSPLKTRADLREALSSGALVNVDNLQELDELAALVEEDGTERKRNHFGVRVNPQVGGGSLAGFSTGTLTSKFGIGLKDDGGKPVMEAFEKYSWLTCIMVHVGSQGIPFDLAVRGIRETVDFALAVNKKVGRAQIQAVDIGGGLSVNFGSDERKPDFVEYAQALRESVPELFDPAAFPLVITEFGRAFVAKSGFFASRIEYVKETGGRRIAIQYAGADSCVRTVYHPESWPLRVSVLDGNCRPFGGDGVETDGKESVGETDIAGPCCIQVSQETRASLSLAHNFFLFFSQADIVAHRRPLPQLSRGDTALLHDVGGYYHSGHTRYNLRQAPAVWSFQDGDASAGKFKFRLLQAAETVESTLDAFCEPGWQEARES
jgi:diaminopimelate decarboxylase